MASGADAVTGRREFLKATAGVAVTAAATGGGVWADTATVPAAAPTAESYARLLYESLSPLQRETICFAWDHMHPKKGLLRSRVEANWHVTSKAISEEFYSDEQRELIRHIMSGIYSPEWLERIDRQMDDDSGGWEENSIAMFGQPGGKFEFVMTGRHLTVRCDGNTAEHVAFGGPIFYGHAAEDVRRGGPTIRATSTGRQACRREQPLPDARRRAASKPPSCGRGTAERAASVEVFRAPKLTPYQGIPVAQLSVRPEGAPAVACCGKLIEPYPHDRPGQKRSPAVDAQSHDGQSWPRRLPPGVLRSRKTLATTASGTTGG